MAGQNRSRSLRRGCHSSWESSRASQSPPLECPPSATSRGVSPCSSHLHLPPQLAIPRDRIFTCFWALQEKTGIHGCQEGSLLLRKWPGQLESSQNHRMVWVGKHLKGHLVPTPAKTRQRKQILPSWSFSPHLAISYLFTSCSSRGSALCPELLNCPWQLPACFNTSPLPAHPAAFPPPSFVMSALLKASCTDLF